MRGQSKTAPPRIAIDLLGSDAPPEQLLDPLLELHKELKDQALFTLFVPANLANRVPSSIQAVVCEEVITMQDDPLLAVRKKKNASLIQGVQLVKERKADAFISAGNTGALLASCQILLPLLPGIERAALLTLLPTEQRELAVLDVGANIACKADHLVQFAHMGIAYQKSRGVERPVVGLLNIGTEPTKGTPEIREAYQRLAGICEKKNAAQFAGNIEGRDVFRGNLDVLVTDGFAGNVFLKTAEGLAAFIWELLEESAEKLDFSPLKNTLVTLRHRLHYAEYPGAIFCGVDGIIVKCHGNASAPSFVSSVKGAMRLVEHNFLEKIKSTI